MIILFDLDGTLIDSTEAILESFDVAFKTFGTAVPDEERIKAEIGHPLDVMFATLGVEASYVDAHVQAYKRHYRKISCAKTVLLPEAREAVELASQHARLGVVTTKTAKYSIELLEHMGLMTYFDVLVGREDVVNPKPHPEPIFKALSKLQSERNIYWMIGDTPMDILAANAAKINSVAVTCGYADETLLLEHTDNVSKSALEAVKFITQL
ncbi:HAD family hydrolase [Sulfurovum sp. XTW-4]|uniref:phosphoglycolate phosphatase n=1 Tax=Sulfurovum xiamenensis TaxID=3019066 RepID=A0ABT7QSB0_9BACT|nr:HAD family hydrolase [Sulfurovum xiamenensis]MDM5263804.1 HAD family hydrolase [Sulfurovum xiamenensis]